VLIRGLVQKRRLIQLISSNFGELGIEKPAIPPDFSIISSEYIDVTHLDHRFGKSRKEKVLIRGISPHLGFYLPPMILGHQNIIRSQQTFSLENVKVVVVVKPCWGSEIKRCKLVVLS
jgi:hypothetical protein